MIEAEVLEVINQHSTNAIDSYAIFVTFTFGYLTVAYFVGDNLSVPQVIIISILYVTSAAIFTISAITHLESIEALVLKYPDFLYSGWWEFPWSKSAVFLNAGGVFASGYFMIDVRKKANQSVNQGLR